MIKNFKFLIIFFIFSNSLFACALCQLQTPTAKISIDINESYGDITWEFSKEFTDELMLSYDKDNNKKFNTNELQEIEKSLTDYLIPNNYLTYFSYYDSNEESQPIKFKVINSNFKSLNNQLFFNYQININLNINSDVLSIIFKDEEEFFNFVINDVKVKFKNPQVYSNIVSNIIFLNLDSDIKPKSTPLITPNINMNMNIIEEEPKSSINSFLEINLKELIDKIKINLNDIKETNSIISLMWLLIFSLVYGIIHALGPGHGKSLVASYFLANDKSYLKATYISSLIGIIHTFSAFIFTLIIYFLVDTFLSNFLGDVTFYTSKISAVIIISIALYLLYKKIPKKQKITKWSSTTHTSSCGCSSCNSTTTDLGVIISAGIIPCPGTVTIFIFTLSMGLYFVGFLSALFMSLGMSLIILFSALLSLTIRKKSNREFKHLTKFLDYASLIFILSLGIILFFAF